MQDPSTVLLHTIAPGETVAVTLDPYALAPTFRGGPEEASALPSPQHGRFAGAGSERLRIAIVSPEVSSGAGVPHYWLALAKALSENHEVHIFTAKADKQGLAGIQLHNVPALSLGWLLPHLTFYLSARLRFLLGRLPRMRRFDLILGVGALTPFADVTTVHFVQAREIELQRQGLLPRQRPLAGLAGLDYAMYSRAMGWLGRRFYRRTRASIVAISQSVKRDIALFEGANPSMISVVPNGVDVDRFHPENRGRYRVTTRESLGLTEEHTAVLFVGNSWGRKGLQTAIKAIEGSDHQGVRLLVVGEGDTAAFTSEVSAEVRERIIFVGSRSTDVERLYAASDVFMLPTLYEPFGLVILEALASGLPSIFSARAGAAEWLEDGVDAIFLQDPADGREAEMALRSIMASPEFAERLSRNGRIAAQKLQWVNVAERLIEASSAPRSTVAVKV